jgi:DNA-binding transcriptional MerR regulator
MIPSLPDKLFFKIGEVSELAGVEQHVLRYWEEEFDVLNPQKNKSGQRLYQKKDIEQILEIKKLLYSERFTIAGARKRLQQKKKSVNQMDFGFDQEMFNAWKLNMKSELKSILKIVGK